MRCVVLIALVACSGSQRAAPPPPPADASVDAARVDAAPPGDAFETSLIPIDADPNAVRIVVNDHEGPCGFMIVLDRIYFASGSSEIQAHQRPMADAVAQALECVAKDGSIKKLEVQGHADDKERDPQRLSEERAVRIANYLTSKGVSAQILQVTGFGNKFPVDQRKTESARAKNRRVDFLILERKEPD